MNAYLHITTLLLATVAAAGGLVAIWAATSRIHWFWRALGVWAFVAAMLPIRAYEPAVVFGIGLPLAALSIRVVEWLQERRQRMGREGSGEFSFFRFGMRDLLLLMALLGLALAVVIAIVRRFPETSWGEPRTAREILLPALAVAAITALAWCVTFGVWRWWAAVGLVGCLFGLSWAMWPSIRWLYMLDDSFTIHYLLPSDGTNRHGLFITILGLTEFGALMVGWLIAMKFVPLLANRWP